MNQIPTTVNASNEIPCFTMDKNDQIVNKDFVVNRDYIGVIENNNNEIRHINYAIPQPVQLIEKLKQTFDDENCGVIDLQKIMIEAYPDSLSRSYSYVYPACYSDAYISGKSLPAPTTDVQFRQREQEMAEAYGKRYDEDMEKSKAERRNLPTVSRETFINEQLCEWRYKLKKGYYRMSLHYILAASYTSARKELSNRPNVKMCTSDRIGWPMSKSRCLRYDITKDISIAVFTNFGYGQSSYFFIGLTYKGIAILPYSMLVKYYYANSVDLARYTRRYKVERASWKRTLDFVAKVANFAMREPENFVKVWVKKEILETVRGLREIVQLNRQTAPGYIGQFYNQDGETPEYIKVRNITPDEQGQYKVYPWEMAMAWRAEKITSSLAFLEPMRAMKPIYNEVDAAIEEIKKMAIEIAPEINLMIESIGYDVESLGKETIELKEMIGAIDVRLVPHLKRLEALYAPVDAQVRGNKIKSWNADVIKKDIESEYEKNNFAYAELIHERAGRCKELSDKEFDIQERKKFIARLAACRDVIAQAHLMAA